MNDQKNLTPVAEAFDAEVDESGKTVDQVIADAMEVPGKRVQTLDKFRQELSQDLVCIRVKITFREEQQPLIPAEFDYRPQRDNEKIQLWHQQEAYVMEKPHLAKVGRHREGMVDTGEPVLESNYPVRMAMLVKGLAANSFHLCNVFVQIKKKPYPPRRPGERTLVRKFHVLNLEFKRGEEPKEFEPKTVAGRRTLMNMTFSFCKIWLNPDQSITVNIGGLNTAGGIAPRYALVVKDHHLATKMLDPVTQDETTE